MAIFAPSPLPELQGFRELLGQLAVELDRVEAWGWKLRNENAWLRSEGCGSDLRKVPHTQQLCCLASSASNHDARPAPSFRTIVSIDEDFPPIYRKFDPVDETHVSIDQAAQPKVSWRSTQQPGRPVDAATSEKYADVDMLAASYISEGDGGAIQYSVDVFSESKVLAPSPQMNDPTSTRHISFPLASQALDPARGRMSISPAPSNRRASGIRLSTRASHFTNVGRDIEASLEWHRRASELRMWFEGLLIKEPDGAEALPPKTIQTLLMNANVQNKRSQKWISAAVQALNEAVDRLNNIDRAQHIIDNPWMNPTGSSEVNFSTSFGLLSMRMRPPRPGIQQKASNTSLDWYDSDSGNISDKVSDDNEKSSVAFRGFVEIIQWSRIDEDEELSPEEKQNILEIREALIIQSVDQLIFEFTNLQAPINPVAPSMILAIMEPMIALMLFCNAFTIGLSSDIAWDGWVVCEAAFTFFFSLEVIVKVCILGCYTHFAGPDRHWNWFDLVVVALAIFDLAITLFARGDNSMNSFTMVRLARLAKITRLMRLIRLLRLRCFKELLLMVKGVIAGMRTLVWAFVLLATLIYILAVMLRQTVGEDRVQVANDPYKTVLFHSIGWSMFNIFRCLTDDCTLLNGTPIVGHMYHHYGYKFVIPYTCIVLFVTFGIFNLIMAVFVENVVESARVKQRLTEQSERARVCKNLRLLIMRFGGREPIQSVKPISIMVGMTSRLKRVFGYVDRPAHGMSFDNLKATHAMVDFQFGGQISREMFNDVISNEDVHDLLDELQIHTADRSELFDVLDADRSGMVDVSELINGLLKMRSGGADKSDIVATILGIRSLQKQITTFCEKTLENQSKIIQVLGVSPHTYDESTHAEGSLPPKSTVTSDRRSSNLDSEHQREGFQRDSLQTMQTIRSSGLYPRASTSTP